MNINRNFSESNIDSSKWLQLYLKVFHGRMRKKIILSPSFMAMLCFEIKRVIFGQFQRSLTLVKPLKMCQQVYIVFCGSTKTYPLTFCKIKWALQQIQTPKYFIWYKNVSFYNLCRIFED